MTTSSLVNGDSLQNSFLRVGERNFDLLDLSYLRIVVADSESNLVEGAEAFSAELVLEHHRCQIQVSVKGVGAGWARLHFEKLPPSVRAGLHTFLSAKRVGKSLREDWRNQSVRHYHGLNESELWFDEEAGSVLFTYLENPEKETQVLIRAADPRSALSVGKVCRQDYLEWNRVDRDPNLIAFNDREAVTYLSDCRDIITNFRPQEKTEYHLKQRLLKWINEGLYSKGHRVEMVPMNSRAST